MTIAAAGARKHVTIPDAQALPDDGPLDVPGRPRPVHTPGHTSGHVVYEVADAGVVLSGDALVTGHRLTSQVGPQMLPGFFTSDGSRAMASLDVIAGLSADTIIPGHGDVWHGDLGEAATLARTRATGSRSQTSGSTGHRNTDGHAGSASPNTLPGICSCCWG